MKTKIVKCICSNEFQDEEYGEGKRVANATSKLTAGEVVYRCTVCLAEHTKGE